MTRPIVMDIIARDNASKTFKQVANSQTQLAKNTDGLARGNDNLRKSQLQLIAAQERYNKVAKDSSASAGKLASSQASLITAQQRVKKATDDSEASATKSKRSWSGAATVAAVAGAAVIGLGKSFVQAATDQQKANAQTAAVIKSTGGAAHVTAAQVSELSGALSKQTGIQDDTIQSGANMLLTFTNIRNEVGKGNDIFNQATKTVVDMSVALGQDMPKSAIQLGKALNDPIKGVTALQRVGVTFTQQQKDQIKVLVETGDTLGAQKVILQELNKEFGGSAAAQATAAGKMSAAWDNFKEAAGNALLPVLSKVFGVLSNLLDVFSKYSGVLVPTTLAIAGFATAVWLVNKASDAWAATTKALNTVLGTQLTGSLKGAVAGLVGSLGPLALVVAGTYAVAQATGGLRGYILNLANSGDAYTKSVNKTADALKTNLTTALRQSTVDHAAVTNEVIAAGKALGGVSNTVFQAGGNWKQFGAAITGTDKQFNAYIDTVRQHMKAAGDDNSVINDAVGDLFKLRDSYTGAASSAKDFVGATNDTNSGLISQQQFLDDNNLTLDQAKQKYNDAYAAAYSFTAQLGYMSKALDTLSNNNITATLQQDQLNLAMGTAADKFAGSRAQVAAHGKALEGNTADAISNRDWALQQIQAINQQAISYAQSTGSIGKGTQALSVNEAALRTSMYQAGFTKAQVDKLLATYAATPSDVATSIREQGAAAVIAALGDLEYWLHRIADPTWAAHIDIIAGANAAQGGKPSAAGGYISGPGGPTSDVIPIMASNGEYIVNARATAQNRALLENINRNKYAAGGLVGALNLTEAAALHADITAAEAKARAAAIAAMPSGVPGGGAVSADVAAEQAYALSQFRYYNWPSSELSSLISLWNGESGWNPGATNPSSGAYGIPQSLPAEKMASAGADWRTNPATQIRWGLSYIASVYGSPSATYGAWLSRSPHWYGTGAWNIGSDQLAGLHKGEMVLPAELAELVRSGAGKGLSPRAIAAAIVEALAGAEFRFDGDGLARLVTRSQAAYAVRGGRR